MRPYNRWDFGEEENIVALATTLLAGIVQNHPFIEGNKRTALVAARALLINNGWDIGVSDDELGPHVRDFAAGHLAEEDLVELFEEHLVAAPF